MTNAFIVASLLVVSLELPQFLGPSAMPTWVAEELAVQDGQLQRDYFTASEWDRWTSIPPATSQVLKSDQADRSRYSQGCVQVRVRKIDRYPARPRNLVQLVGSAKTLARGVVEEMGSGFWKGHPSTMLRLGILDPGEEAGGPTSSTVLVVLLNGVIQTESGSICGNPSERPLPEIGDTLILIAARDVAWSAEEPTVLFDDEYFFVGAKENHPPKQFLSEMSSKGPGYLSSVIRLASENSDKDDEREKVCWSSASSLPRGPHGWNGHARAINSCKWTSRPMCPTSGV